MSNDGLLELIMKQSILSKCLLLSAHFGNRVHLHKRRIFQSEGNCGIFFIANEKTRFQQPGFGHLGSKIDEQGQTFFY